MMYQEEASWRQGSLITRESSHTLGFFEKNSLDKYIIIISHDCDILNEKEDNVEVIISNIVTKVDPVYVNNHGKRPIWRSPKMDHLAVIENGPPGGRSK